MINDEIIQSLRDGDIVEKFTDREYLLLEYAIEKFSQNRYALTIANAYAEAKVLFKLNAVQKIRSSNFFTPKMDYFESISSSTFVHTCSRFYDYLDGNIIAYEQSNPSDFERKDLQSVSVSYDDFIIKYGKLHKRKYFVETKVKTKTDNIGETFLTDNENVYRALTNPNKAKQNGIIPYIVTREHILKSSIVKLEDGNYQLEFDLDADSTIYFQAEMKTTGRLNDYPKFESTHLVFILDKKLELVKGYFVDQFSASLGLLSGNLKLNNEVIYLHSSTSEFRYKDKKVYVTVPGEHEAHFKAYDLLDN
jgi:hypothetical protein